MKLTYALSQLEDVAQQIISHSKSNILLFYGEMGDGKTTLIKALCTVLGVEAEVTSPTYTLVNEYITQQNEKVYHFDFYRIEREEEVLDIGFEQYLEQGAWIFIEWPQKIINIIPEISQKVIFHRLNENERIVEIS